MQRGFTLIEALISSFLVAMILGALMFSFRVGIQLYQKISAEVNEDTLVFLEMRKFERDMRNAFVFQGIPFVGESEKISFPGFVVRGEGKERKQAIGRITYFYDPERKALVKEERGYAASFDPDAAPSRSPQLITPIEAISFSYFDAIPETESYDWFPQWDQAGKLPLGVKVEVTVMEGTQRKMFTSFISLPIAYEA